MTETICPSRNLTISKSFAPPWYLRNGHVQTLAGMYLYSPKPRQPNGAILTSTSGQVELQDGDRLVYQDDCPAGWEPGHRTALLLHGLAGSHASPHVVRISRLLNREGVRTFRLDWRGCGAGMMLARYPYHSGRSDDLAAAVSEIHARCPGSPLSVIGLSLGGNIALKWLGEAQETTGLPANVDRAIAVCPPIDLQQTVSAMSRGLGRLYDQYFCRSCLRTIENRQLLHPEAILPEGWGRRFPRTLSEFDDTFTAPICGFESAADYYARSSSNQFLSEISVPTLVIAAQDDPLIPFSQFQVADYSSSTHLLAPRHGGHLGFCQTRGPSWLDQRIVKWVVDEQ